MRATILASLLLVAVPAVAASPDAGTLIQKMRDALEPARASTRKVTIVLNAVAPETETVEWTAGQARKRLADGRRILTVMLAPASERGIALLVQEQQKKADVQWFYLPAVRRTRALVRADAYQSFLNTDFTYTDLGFVTQDARYKVVGNETRDGIASTKIEGTPREQWYYSRFVFWIANDTSLPLREEFYDPSGSLWKVETWGVVTRIDGTPVPLQVRMEDVRQGGSTELRVSDVVWDRELPDDLFDPRKLRDVATSPVWTAGK
jgi:hypothetical protein